MPIPQSLLDAVERNKTVDASIIALVQGLAAKIEELKNDPAALQALADSLNADHEGVVAVVNAHTPSDPNLGQAERVAAHLRVLLTEELQEWTDAYVERLELIHGPKR